MIRPGLQTLYGALKLKLPCIPVRHPLNGDEEAQVDSWVGGAMLAANSVEVS